MEKSTSWLQGRGRTGQTRGEIRFPVPIPGHLMYFSVMERFAVVDTETTGFGKADRVVEIGIVLVDGNEITQEWETLINPERDISNSNIHGITSDTVSLAPVFSEVIDEISAFLNDRIFVAHNIPFDTRMLGQEFARLNRVVDFGKGFCTLQATRSKLEVACLKYGVTNSSAHRALTDARATALILNQVFGDDSELTPVRIEGFSKGMGARTFSRSALDTSHTSGQQNLRRIVRNYEMVGKRGIQLSYMDALSSVMNDFVLTHDELRHLKEWAADLGISSEEQKQVHEDFLSMVVDAANRDGYLSDTELELISKVAVTLGLEAPTSISTPIKTNPVVAGAHVCFTGVARDDQGVEIPREVLEQLARSRGLVPVKGVTRKECNLLVAADKSSMSGKTKNARAFGIPVLSVDEFLKSIS